MDKFVIGSIHRLKYGIYQGMVLVIDPGSDIKILDGFGVHETGTIASIGWKAVVTVHREDLERAIS